MSDREEANSPEVEPAPNEGTRFDFARSGGAIRQQEILAQLGVSALQGATFEDLLNETARLTAEGFMPSFARFSNMCRAKIDFLFAPEWVGAWRRGRRERWRGP